MAGIMSPSVSSAKRCFGNQSPGNAQQLMMTISPDKFTSAAMPLESEVLWMKPLRHAESQMCYWQVTAGCWRPSRAWRWTRSCCTEWSLLTRASARTTPASSTSRFSTQSYLISSQCPPKNKPLSSVPCPNSVEQLTIVLRTTWVGQRPAQINTTQLVESLFGFENDNIYFYRIHPMLKSIGKLCCSDQYK